ncbi:MAG: hypothetical protein ACKVWV_07580 [Planctomycetota bacterium]
MFASLVAASSFHLATHLLAIPLAVTLPAPPLVFGPPLVCHEIAIGDAKSLPWGSGTKPKAGYDRAHLVADVAELLKTEEHLLVRMETLRRAAMYAHQDRALVWELVGWRSLFVLEQCSIGAQESTAWFDLGVLVACFDQLAVGLDRRSGVAEGIGGYGFLRKALETARADGRDTGPIEFAAVLVTHPGGGRDAEGARRRAALCEGRWERAKAQCDGQPLLAQNVTALHARFASER